MDGNRRYAKKNNLPLKQAYSKGMMQTITILKEHLRLNIPFASFFALSSDNVSKRTKTDLIPIGELLVDFFKNNEINQFFKENQIHVKLKGNLEELEQKQSILFNFKNQEIKQFKEKYEEHNKTIQNPKLTCTIALNYGGQEEILYAIKQIIKQNINNPTLEDIKKNLYFNDIPSPEIIVRTGDAPRISGFLLFDSAYSELYLSKKLWPELTSEDITEITTWFEKVQRNFGK
jgi:undecaprenyl diphosphate synthase